MATKGQKFKHWTAEEKYQIIKPVLNMEKSINNITREKSLNSGMVYNWIKTYREKGFEGLNSKKKSVNPLLKYSNKKILQKKKN